MNRRVTLKILTAMPLIAMFPSVSVSKNEPIQKKANKLKKKDTKKTTSKSNTVSDNLIDEKEALAKAMQYHHDASKAPAMRTNKKSFCYNCEKYNKCMEIDKTCKPLDAKALKTANAAPCQIFQKKNVAKNGWCLSWQAMV